MELPHDLVKAGHQVIGVDVKNNEGEDLGCIKEIILEKVEGNVRYIVLECGSFLGLKGKYFAIPWNSIDYDKDEECFRLDIKKEDFKNAPGFDKDHWPNMADTNWGKQVHAYFKSKPYWE
ncbi:MAG TPA: PRC-barrel domain-containing protein [Gammaproteobacteria bacterium]|nr:PRC-barrel domain-containing protein [Gammaproteobacteria bacterium]